MKYKTTKKDFELFKKQCRYWQVKLGLISWKIYYLHEDCKDALADCSTDYSGRVATIRLNTCFCTIKSSKELIYECALHEILEVLFSPICSLAKARVWDGEDYEKENHSVIRVLEKILGGKV